ncbi:MAG: crossover junction endodeoxyribonuclease RuvC [Cytophagales bacterium]|nr:crossover junction endodeoxyribonuclease RuvC [Cytophagales bacterium]
MGIPQKSIAREKIILGIDPGTSAMGYGLLLIKNKNISVIQYGIIHLKKYANHETKLRKIFERVTAIIDEFHPDEVALEAPFFGKNVQSMLKLGRAQGAAMVAALNRDLPITEYAPRKVKQSVTGNGNATKEQVAAMLQKMLKLAELPKMLDATDALGVALTHHNQGGIQTSKAKNWSSFLADNPERLVKK